MKSRRRWAKSRSSIITTNKNSTITAPTYTKIRIKLRNSALRSIQIPDALKKAKTRNKAACTGFETVTTRNAEITNRPAKAKKNTAKRVDGSKFINQLSIWCVGLTVCCNLLFILVANRQQHLFRKIQITPLITKVFKDIRFDNRIDWASLFAKTTEDALG